eukprot:353133-Chlamydomonas_euryale.AAC.1
MLQRYDRCCCSRHRCCSGTTQVLRRRGTGIAAAVRKCCGDRAHTLQPHARVLRGCMQPQPGVE